MCIEKRYYIIYNPLTVTLLDHLGQCRTPLDLLSIITGQDASRLAETNFPDFLTVDLSTQREGLIEILALEHYVLTYLANQLLQCDPGSKIILADGKRKTLREIIETKGYPPAAVLITTMSSNFPAAVAAAIALNHGKIPVVLGGIHVSTTPGDVDIFIRQQVPFPGLVAHVCGPGDSQVMKQLVEDIKNQRLKKEYHGTVTIEDGKWGEENIEAMEPMKMALLKKIPFIGSWVVDRFRLNGIVPYLGCPYSCNFCSISTLPREQKAFKTRSPGDIIAELEYYQRDGVHSRNRLFYFLSDNLLFGGKALEEMLDKIIASDLTINFACQVSIDIADKDDLLDKLRLAGASQLFIGLESLDLRNLERIGKKIVKEINASGLSVKEYYTRQIRKIQQRGISVHGAFMFGLPYDYFHSFADNSAVEVIDFCKKTNIGGQATCLTDLPGSLDFKQSLEDGTFIYGEPGSMDYLLALSIADLSEGNRPVPDSLKNSFLIQAYLVYEMAWQVGSPGNALRNALAMAKKSWRWPTKNGRKSLAARFYETFLTFANQWLNSLYRECYQALVTSRPGRKGSFERLYHREENPGVKALFKDYVDRFG